MPRETILGECRSLGGLLAPAAAPRAVIGESHRREENHPDGDEDELDRHDDQDHPPDATWPRQLRRRLGCGHDGLGHEASLGGKTKANSTGYEATPAARFS